MLYFANWKVFLICAVCALGVLSQPSPTCSPSAACRRCRAGCRTSRSRSVSTCAAARICCSRSMSPRPSASGSTRSTRPCATRCATPRSAIPGSNQGNAITFTIRDPARSAAARQALAQARPRSCRRYRRGRRRHDQLPAGRDSTRAASRPSTQSIEIIRRRIDETGTKEPTIQREGQDRILVQLPGVDNPEHVKALLGPHRQADLPAGRHQRQPSRRRGAAGCRRATRSCRRRRNAATPGRRHMSCASASWSAATC